MSAGGSSAECGLARRALLQVVGAGCAVASLASLAGCGAGASGRSGSAPGATGTGSGSGAPAPAPSASAAASWSVPDPRSLTGLSTADDIGDITPVTTTPAPVLPVSLTDADGKAVTVTDVSRVLALDLYSTLSRTVEGLGLGDSLVGRGQSSTEAAVSDLPVVVRNGLEINVEAVLALSPSVVLVDHSLGPAEAIDQIRAAGTTVVVLDPQRTLDSIEDDVAAVGAALGCDKEAAALAARARSEVDGARATIAQWVPAQSLRTAFLYVRGTGGVFFVLGKGYGGDVLIDAIGCEDVATEAGMEEVTPATAEALARLDPELILTMTGGLDSTGGIDGLVARAGVAQTTAGSRRRVVAIPDGQSLAFGPQAGASLLATARAVYQPVEA